jgi:DNA polymerase-3 subunit alpha
MFEALDSVLDQAAVFQREKNEGQVNLFDAKCEPGEALSLNDTPLMELSEWDNLTKLSFEKEIMGFYVTGHPLMNYEDIMNKYTNATCAGLIDIPESSQVRLAGLVKRIKEINTKKGERMAFVSFEDLTGVVDVTVFSELYLRNRDLVKSTEPLIISGIREGDRESPKILAQEICRIQDASRKFSKGMRIKISTRGADPHQIKDLKAILLRHKGPLPVKLHIVIPNRTETVINLSSVACEPSDSLMDEMHNAFGYQIHFE